MEHIKIPIILREFPTIVRSFTCACVTLGKWDMTCSIAYTQAHIIQSYERIDRSIYFKQIHREYFCYYQTQLLMIPSQPQDFEILAR